MAALFSIFVSLVQIGAVIFFFLLAEKRRRQYVMAAIYVRFVAQMVIREPHRWNAVESQFMLEQAEIAMTDPNPFWKFWDFDPKREINR